MSKERSSPEMNPFTRKSYEGISALLDAAFNIRVFEDHQRKELAALLYEHSLIVPFNHPSVFDPIAVARELRTSFPDVPRILLPATQKFYDGRMGKPAKAGMDYFAKAYDLELIPVIQHYDDNYSDAEKGTSYTKLFRAAFEVLKTSGNIFMVAPEGTRSTEGQMGQAQSGIGRLMQRFPDSIVCPISVYGTEEVMYEKERGTNKFLFNPLKSGNLVYGTPMRSEDMLCVAAEMDMSPQDMVMYQLAEQLPERYRGNYGS